MYSCLAGTGEVGRGKGGSHYKQNSIGESQIYATMLVRLCDIVAPLVLILRTCMIKQIYPWSHIIRITNIFVLLNNKKVKFLLKTFKISIFRSIYFSLVCPVCFTLYSNKCWFYKFRKCLILALNSFYIFTT